MKFNVFIKIIILSIILISCSENKNNKTRKVNVGITKNDTVVKKVSVTLETEYNIFGAGEDSTKIILSENTFNQTKGKFGFGVNEKKNPFNKIFSFTSPDTLDMPDLNNLESMQKFCLINEFEKSVGKDSVKAVLKWKDPDMYGERYGKHLSFNFVNIHNDTIGYQNSYFMNMDGRLVTIHLLTDTKKKFLELQKMTEDFANEAIK